MRRFALLLACVLLGLLAPPAAANDSTPVENTRAGDSGWSPNPAALQTRWGQPSSASELIEAYASRVSVVAGQPLSFAVRTKPSAPYRLEVHRLGWYGGTGGRRVLCQPSCSGSFSGADQPDPPAPDPATGRVDAGWTPNHTVATGASWASGYYAAEFTLTGGAQAGRSTQVVFVVRSPAPDPDAILVMAATNTWQAYNYWGGKSLYLPRTEADRPATKVSSRRPYTRSTPAPYRYELQLMRYLEREGRNVEYTTNLDVDREPASVQRHPLAISNGHDEYWSMAVRDAFESARDAGTNLAFFSSNSAYWHVRHEDDRTTLVGFKDTLPDTEAPSPGLATRRFRDIGRPECSLLGVMYQGGYTSDESVNRKYTVQSAALSHPWMAGAGFVGGDQLEYSVGYEWDARISGCTPANAVTFFERRVASEPEVDRARGDGLLAQAAGYRAPSGATVFATGSMAFNFTLDEFQGFAAPANQKAQTFVRTLIGDLSDRVTQPWPGFPPEPGSGASPSPTPASGPDTAPTAEVPPTQASAAQASVAQASTAPAAVRDPVAGTPVVTPAADRAGPRLTVTLPRTARLRRAGAVDLVVRCSEVCSGSARATLTGTSAGSRARPLRILRRTGSDRRMTWRLTLSRSERRRVIRALATGRRVRIAFRVSAVDRARNRTSVARSIPVDR